MGGLQSQTIYRKVKVVKQTLEELLEANKQFLDWLKNYFGDDARESFINHLKTELSFVPPTGTDIELELIKLGDHSLIYGPYTAETMFGIPKDPINLIFYGSGSANTVEELMCNKLSKKWYDIYLITSTQYAYIDNSSHGGDTDERNKWIKVSKSLSDKPFDGLLRHRMHLRIFESPKPCNHNIENYGTYSVASVHQDHRICHFLGPLDFITSREKVRDAFTGFRYSIDTIRNEDYRGIINGCFHDGEIVHIKIT